MPARRSSFYQSVFGGHLVVNTYADFGTPAEIPGSDKVVFGLVARERLPHHGLRHPSRTEGGIAGDGATHRENSTTVTDQAVFVSISTPTLEELQGYWDTLAVDATVVEPLAASAWSAGFGMLTDQFGVTWSVSVVAD